MVVPRGLEEYSPIPGLATLPVRRGRRTLVKGTHWSSPALVDSAAIAHAVGIQRAFVRTAADEAARGRDYRRAL